MFVDATGFSFRAKVATTWAPIGQTPTLRRISKRRERSTVIGLPRSGKIDTRHVEHPIGAEDILVRRHHVPRYMARPMIIVWDRWSAHRAMAVKGYVAAHPAMAVAWLPPYAPDLNPEEGCHGHVKPHLRHAISESLSAIRTQVDRGFARLRRRPDLILGFFRHAGLDVNQLG